MTILTVLLVIFFIWSRYDQYLNDRATDKANEVIFERLYFILEELKQLNRNLEER